ncbi:hypothetical protein M885DRAFT_538840 [Pelagophyceae sp. CCMP2097]|nr:hypothetical protein M885DRAFT_538840 [Pelagophyceae sp. CCMP2097]
MSALPSQKETDNAMHKAQGRARVATVATLIKLARSHGADTKSGWSEDVGTSDGSAMTQSERVPDGGRGHAECTWVETIRVLTPTEAAATPVCPPPNQGAMVQTMRMTIGGRGHTEFDGVEADGVMTQTEAAAASEWPPKARGAGTEAAATSV